MNNLTTLRRQIRAARRQITGSERERAQQHIQQHIYELPIYQSAQRIAMYWASDGEVAIDIIAQQARAAGKQTYYPIIIGRGQPLAFAPYTDDTATQRNYFNIIEPVVDQSLICPPQHLDLVLNPLVAFDDTGMRLGMGGGFYDRSFAFKQDRDNTLRPYLLGIAFDVQRVEEALPRRDWDIPLDGLVTETCVRDWQATDREIIE